MPERARGFVVFALTLRKYQGRDNVSFFSLNTVSLQLSVLSGTEHTCFSGSQLPLLPWGEPFHVSHVAVIQVEHHIDHNTN
jgi:hypothetical protein